MALSGIVVGIGCSSSDETPDNGSSSSSSGGSSGSSSGSSGKTTTSSSGSSGTSSTSSGGDPTCNPMDGFAYKTPVYVSSGGRTCDALAKQQNEAKNDLNYVYAKQADGKWTQLDAEGKDPEEVSMTLDEATCTLTGSHAAITGEGPDTDGTKVKFILEQTDTVKVSATSATIEGKATLDSDPPGSGGFPCTITFTATGERKDVK